MAWLPNQIRDVQQSLMIQTIWFICIQLSIHNQFCIGAILVHLSHQQRITDHRLQQLICPHLMYHKRINLHWYVKFYFILKKPYKNKRFIFKLAANAPPTTQLIPTQAQQQQPMVIDRPPSSPTTVMSSPQTPTTLTIPNGVIHSPNHNLVNSPTSHLSIPYPSPHHHHHHHHQPFIVDASMPTHDKMPRVITPIAPTQNQYVELFIVWNKKKRNAKAITSISLIDDKYPVFFITFKYDKVYNYYST